MATGNIDSFDLKSIAKGGVINEDVMQKIFDISKIPLPFTDLVGSSTHKNGVRLGLMSSCSRRNQRPR